MTLLANRLRIADQNFERLSFKASPSEDAWNFEELILESAGVEIKGSGKWFDDGTRFGMTKLDFDVASEVGGQALTDLGFGGFLKDGKIELTSNVNWRGAPAHFSLDRLNGDYSLNVLKGSFPTISSNSGRLLGLLNINALSRRLRLDFGDVFGEGLAFDQMRTKGIFNEGDIVLKEFFIFAPSVYVEALGNVKLAKEEYDLQMLVSPQLGGNVALLTALSNPAAGAVVWLVDQIFDNPLSKFIVYRYDITGPWNKPIVNREQGNNTGQNNSELGD